MNLRSFVGHLFRTCIFAFKKRIYQEILVLGDSHATVFRHTEFRKQFRRHFFTVVSVPGATVSGFKNPNSKTQALPNFTNNYECSSAKTTVVLLGEVDTGFVIWYRAEKHSASVEDMLDQAVENYQGLLKAIAKKSRVICISTPLPTIQDGQDWGEIADARKAVKATQTERTHLTLQFNRRMRDFCDLNGYSFLSFDEESLGPNGVVKASLLNANPYDHHYDDAKYATMLIGKLKPCIE